MDQKKSDKMTKVWEKSMIFVFTFMELEIANNVFREILYFCFHVAVFY